LKSKKESDTACVIISTLRLFRKQDTAHSSQPKPTFRSWNNREGIPSNFKNMQEYVHFLRIFI